MEITDYEIKITQIMENREIKNISAQILMKFL